MIHLHIWKHATLTFVYSAPFFLPIFLQVVLIWHDTNTTPFFCFIIVYVKGKHVSYQRSKNVTNPNTSLIKIEGVADKDAAKFYLGKRVAYVYKASNEVRGTKIRCMWGKITRAHGNNGLVRAQFKNNLPAKTFGASVRIMLYPSNI